MTDALIGDLAQIRTLRVISRTSIMQYKGTRKTVREIAAELGVDALVEGTVMREGNRVRITAQLIDARTDSHLWADRYDRDLRGVLALQSDVAREIARQIRIEMTPHDAKRLANRRPIDPRAHDAYLKGRYRLGQFQPEAVRQAIVHFEEAARIDQDYALAYASMAYAYTLLRNPLGAISAEKSMPRVRAAAMNALEIDPMLGEAHGALALVKFEHDWDWVGAEEEFKRAIELSPNDPYGHLWYGFYLVCMRRFDEGLHQAETSVRVAPFDLMPRMGSSILLGFAGQPERGLEEAKRLIELNPKFARGHWAAARLYQWAGGHEKESFGADMRFYELSGFPEETRTAMRRAFEASGQRGFNRMILEVLKERDRTKSVGGYRMAIAHREIGDHQGALRWLERAYEERDPALIYLNVGVLSEEFGSDPRFVALLRRMKFPGS